MSDHLILQVELLRDHILTTNDETTNQLLVALQPARNLQIGPTKTNIILVLDDSGSMTGPAIEQVLAATRGIAERLGPEDNLGIVGFADEAEVVHPIVSGLHKESIRRVTDPYVWAHGRRGYGTNMAFGIQRAHDELMRVQHPQRVNRMILFTDGFASDPTQALEIARRVSASRVAITALGFGGEFDMQFMDKIAAFSGGAAEYIDPRNLEGAVANFLDQLSSIQSQLTDNTRIRLKFRGDHRITDFYQTHPKVIYHGLARLDEDRSWSHRLADVERKAGLEMVFTLVHPKDAPGRRLVAEIEVQYDLPAAGLFDQVLNGRVIVDYGEDERLFSTVNQRVQRRYNDAFVEKQQLRARQLIESGQVDDAMRVLGTIKKRGNEQVQQIVEGTMKKLSAQGSVDKEDMFRLKMGTQKKSKDETPT